MNPNKEFRAGSSIIELSVDAPRPLTIGEVVAILQCFDQSMPVASVSVRLSESSGMIDVDIDMPKGGKRGYTRSRPAHPDPCPMELTADTSKLEEGLEAAHARMQEFREELAAAVAMQDGPFLTLPDGYTATQAPPDIDDRLAILPICDRHLLDLLTGRTRIANLPADAKLLGVYYDYRVQSLALKLSSSEFKRVIDGAHIPNFLAECEDAGPTLDDFLSAVEGVLDDAKAADQSHLPDQPVMEKRGILFTIYECPHCHRTSNDANAVCPCQQPSRQPEADQPIIIAKELL